jgi:exopolysaccharide biosynthesis polyprenyl glycosylphosphotransferase
MGKDLAASRDKWPARSDVRTRPFPEAILIPEAGSEEGTRTLIVPPSVRRTPPPAFLPMQTGIALADLVGLLGSIAMVGQMGPLGIGFAVAAFGLLRALGTHTPQINPRLASAMARMLGSIAVSVVVVGLLHDSAASAGRFLLVGPVAAGVVIPIRGLVYTLIRTARSRGVIREPTVIIGTGAVGREVARTLREHPEYGLIPVGFIDSVEKEGLPLPVLGPVGDLRSLVGEYGVQRVIVAFGSVRDPNMVEVLRAADGLPIEVHLVLRFFELGVSAGGPYNDDIWGIPLIRLRRAALRSMAWRMKRIVDVVAGSLLLVLASPLMLGAAVAVALSSSGPILFRQTRIGQRGRPFQCLKFRTLRVNEGSDSDWSVAADDRVTRVGRILRHTSLDELPQLFNVLLGNMSLVGPRPERPHFVERFAQEVSRYDDRHRVPVGITGWAQIHGLRGDTSIPERIRFDNYYIEHWSPWLDAVILFRTIWLIVTGRH